MVKMTKKWVKKLLTIDKNGILPTKSLEMCCNDVNFDIFFNYEND